MPAPSAAQIEGIASAALQSNGIEGENAPDLAKALAATIADALGNFVSMAKVLPGIPAAVDPITGSGATAGPGTFLPPPAGGPGASQIEAVAASELDGNGIQGENAPDLAKVIAGTVAEGVNLFTAQVMVAPGIAVAGFTTVAPGSLL